jgi:hypothetical protein
LNEFFEELELARKKQKNQKLDPAIWVIIIGGLMLIIAVVILLIQAQPGSQSTTNTVPTVFVPYADVDRVSIQDAKAAYDAGTAVFVDVRGDDLYNVGHIPGALSIDGDQIETRFNELNPNDWIITYCT